MLSAVSLTSNSIAAVNPLRSAPILANTELSDALIWSIPAWFRIGSPAEINAAALSSMSKSPAPVYPLIP